MSMQFYDNLLNDAHHITTYNNLNFGSEKYYWHNHLDGGASGTTCARILCINAFLRPLS